MPVNSDIKEKTIAERIGPIKKRRAKNNTMLYRYKNILTACSLSGRIAIKSQ